MNTISVTVKTNINAKYTTWLDDLAYLKALNINNCIINSDEDVDCLIKIIDELDDIRTNHVNKYEAWLASSFDHHYGWDTIPSRYIKQYITDALDKFNKLYLKVIDNRIINLYSEDCTDRNKLVISFSIISD